MFGSQLWCKYLNHKWFVVSCFLLPPRLLLPRTRTQPSNGFGRGVSVTSIYISAVISECFLQSDWKTLHLSLRGHQYKPKKIWSSQLCEDYGIKLRIQTISDQQETRWDHFLGDTVILHCCSLTCFGSQSYSFIYDNSLLLVPVQNTYIVVEEKLLSCNISKNSLFLN